ncbi:MAG: carboxylating nicotinate-nucleotide diphosphorylase [Gammaproteobacteria bacterium]|nr:carboxylating nicotinate-nucleotide diphosphorylase [Gammaproteobacteria bacterium]MDH3986565.1 carboxylating nicotinate-nucleotide diphosphorylase [Gammaproteobacteria bacterium]
MLLDVLEESMLHAVRAALDEDIGSGDITATLIPDGQTASATVICRQQAVLCGQPWFDAVFAELDSRISVCWQAHDGDSLKDNQTLCTVTGPARSILSGERTALNFLQTLSATATLARRYADTVADLPVRILDTRKTIPGMRQAQKYAVRTGGCDNHRSGLYDSILIKENHIAATGSIHNAVSAARNSHANVMIEVEVENEDQLQQALDAGADRLLLDNFDTDALTAAVQHVAGRAELEASGNISLENLRDTAGTGVDFISIGALTKNIQAIDLTMLFSMSG